MTLIARLENIRQPHNEPYADGSLDGRDSTLLCSTQVDVEEPAVQTIPPSALLCQCLGRSRRSSPVHTARAPLETACVSVPDVPAHVPGVMFIFTSMPPCSPCLLWGWGRVMSCQPKSMGLAVADDGMA